MAVRSSVAFTDEPDRAALCNDVMPGLHIALFRHSGVISCFVDDTRKEVFVLGLFYGGQEWDRHMLTRR